jgi:preprotein translocase subunit SecA
MFQELLNTIEASIADTIMKVGPQAQANQPARQENRQTVSNKATVGRNDPCPCGKIDSKTGRPVKYKKCCYPKFG